MANTVALVVDTDEIGVRFQKLNLPPRPLIMDKSSRQCQHHQHTSCFCYEYTTLLDRPEYTGKYLRESPEPDSAAAARTPKVSTNGSTPNSTAAIATKKFKLGQYLAGKTTTPKPDHRSSETSPSNATNAPVRSTLPPPPPSLPPPPPPPASAASHSSHSKTASRSNTPTTNKSNAANPVMDRSRGSSKTAIPIKRTSDLPPMDEPKPSPKINYSELSRPSKRPRLSPPPQSRQPLPPPPPRRERSPHPLPASASSSRQRSPPPPPRRNAASPPPPPPPPRRSATPALVLPPILSPTLPKIIEDALAAEDNLDDEIMAKPTRDGTPLSVKEGRGKASQSSKKPPTSSSTPSGRSPRSVASPAKTLPKKSSLGAAAAASKTTGKRPASPNPSSPRSRISATSSKHPPAASATTATPQKSRIVKFRFKRRLKDFQSFCKISLNKRPRPSASLEESNGFAKPKMASAASLNVPKISASAARSPAFKSPALKAPVTERDVVTPPPKKVNGTTGGKKPERSAITPASNRDDRNGVPRVIPHISQQFSQDYEKFASLGKSTKHEADAIFRSGTSDTRELHRALVIAADSTLCFILAFVLSDRARALDGGRPPTADMWRTFIPLSMFVSDKAKASHAHTLYGFCKQMETVVRQHVFDMDVAQFGRASLPDATSKAPTPDSSNSVNNERSRYLGLKSRLVQDSRDLRECWNEGVRYLSFDDISGKFPQTYAARSTKWVDPETQLPKAVGTYKQAFQLPLHRNSTPLETVNFGRRFIEEWATGNRVQYRSKLYEWLN